MTDTVQLTPRAYATALDRLRAAEVVCKLATPPHSMSLYEEHEWLCHPGESCEDGCDASVIPGRLRLREAISTWKLARKANHQAGGIKK